MTILERLVEQAREQTQQNELVEGEGTRSYDFGDATGEGRFPNASEYSESNQDVGFQVNEQKTVRVFGEDQIASLAKKASTGLQGLDEFLNITDPIIEKFIFDSDFVFNQTKLRSLNKLSGKVFNPIGITASLLSDDDNNVAKSALRQAMSDLVGGGAYQTTDGSSFYAVFDSDYQKEIFTAENFKNKAGGKSLADSFVDSALSSLGQAVGIQVPTRTIMAQALAYSEDLLSHDTWYGNSKITSKNWNSDTTVEMDGISDEAINFQYDPDLVTSDPVKYFDLKRKIRAGLMADAMLAEKPQDIIDAEENNKIGSDSVLDTLRNFAEDRLIGDFTTTGKFYQNRKASYEPDRDENFTQKLLEHYFSDKVGNNRVDDSISGTYLKRVLRNIADSFPSTEGIYEQEQERLEILDRYDGDLNSIRDTEGFKDEQESESTGLKYHNIQTKLGQNLSRMIRDKTFSEYRSASDSIPEYEDEILLADIQPPTEFGTTHFMSFQDIRTEKVCYLRPTFDNINEDIQVSNSDINYIGRTEPFPNYENTTKNITFSFMLYCETPKTYQMMYKKLAFLKSLAYPIASRSDDFRIFQNPLLRFSLGDLYRDLGGYLNTINTSFSNQDHSWETAEGYMGSKVIDVSISFTVLHDTMPFVDINNNFNFDESDDAQFMPHNVDYSEFNS